MQAKTKTKVRTPLRYPGGKSRAVKSIMQQLPAQFSEYREPFLGGGSVFIHLRQQFPDCQFWVNDLYEELYQFWNCTKEDLTALIVQIKAWRSEFSVGKQLYSFLVKNIYDFPDLQKAAAFFILNRITFSGTSESGGFSKAAFETRFTDSSIERVIALNAILKDVKITNLDYQQLVEKAGENVFIFLDPPYYSATKSALYGKNGQLHKGFDHERFAETMKNCPHKWLITYDDSDYIKDLFSFAKIKTWNLTYGMRNVGTVKQKASEVFISNY